MTKKDFTSTENKDREMAAEKDWQSHHDETTHYPEEASGVGEVDVKNAHATGDGSFGRNDESIPDKEEDRPKDNNTY
ncbi:hypothetical protein [Flavisolibacter ginsenosidimutans]|uniref:Uncharacterized protein n=1 Tax=Flavisolibacter ginsenosidimutans TaxID=661481 RepID=A0A5B8UHD8_9BACT|nr:hypothetical protein [Flavisolibacter ginsenosidimutans]QEC55746.1 hypothetical protein FSB75_07530 [Flavisolibacter ginsenosidimutans]